MKLKSFMEGKKCKQKLKLFFISFAWVLSSLNLMELILLADVAKEDYSNLVLGRAMNKATFILILEANSLKEVSNSTRLFDLKHSYWKGKVKTCQLAKIWSKKFVFQGFLKKAVLIFFFTFFSDSLSLLYIIWSFSINTGIQDYWTRTLLKRWSIVLFNHPSSASPMSFGSHLDL
jgi:hypothetical protein